MLTEYVHQEPQLRVEDGLRVGQRIGTVLPEHLEADGAQHPSPQQKALGQHLIIAREAEFLPDARRPSCASPARWR